MVLRITCDAHNAKEAASPIPFSAIRFMFLWVGGPKKISDLLKPSKGGKCPIFVGNRERLNSYPPSFWGENNLKLKSPSGSSQGLGSKGMSLGDAQPREPWGANNCKSESCWAGLSGEVPTKAKHHKHKRREGQREELDPHAPISCYSPIEKGIKDSLFLNCPFSRKCSGLKVSGVAHSAGSLCSAVRLVMTMVPWRRQKWLMQDITQHVCAEGRQSPGLSQPGVQDW